MKIILYQEILGKWLKHNFPKATPRDQFIGIVEEVGELARAELKGKQKIRGYNANKVDEITKDAVGDIFIYLANYCNVKGISLQECIDIAWEEISQRDWIKNPETGKEENEVL